MKTPEGKVKDAVKKLFAQYKVYYHMPVMNGMGAPTLDFICCHNGRFIGVETKAPGKHPTPRQRVTMNEIAAAGGYVFEISGPDGLAQLEAYLVLIGE